MKNKYIFALIALFFLLINNIGYAQSSSVEMADKWRGEGKIYIVIVVILVILAGLFFYIIRAERKIKRLEEKNKNQ
jgi:membrane protein DedA with SNARE-associated domain